LFFGMELEIGLEPIAVELSGGQFLPPVQTLVATMIVESYIVHHKSHPNRGGFFLYQAGDRLQWVRS